ncbi:hypothetical protein OSCT_3008 [Oscillochloris trichoides DG-6]|uniref:Uncharacterized protein n=1 Tax=Oscillochloris trichoides DG-6 TaxID=765420 RepID=E1II57_9CHLR|nr:hypothetical protein [Oscillochloris trichoides]EFO79175.1 hypothetical protein OSCT_3008 [Oscillochloris trichoides DG-6]
MSLLLQSLLLTTPQALAPTPTALPPTPSIPATPLPAPLPADERVLRLALLDLEAEDRHLWSAIYLLRTASQIDDALLALQSNDLDAARRALLNARRSLDQAYAISGEPEKGPIDTFRLQIGQIRNDLYLRPEGLDRRLRQVRQLMLSLVDAGGM